jgi:hypothetical protein
MRETWRTIRYLAAPAAPLMLAAAVAGLAPASAPAATCESWGGSPPVSPGTSENRLQAVAVLSACNAWAVGTSDGPIAQTLTEHWDGASWTVVPSPSPGSNSLLGSVRAASPTSVWAVGEFNNGSGDQPLILHWDGTAWTQQTISSPGHGDLNGVRVVSQDDVWAVGSTFQDNTEQTLILHWDGTAWTQVTSPNPGPDNILFGVAATSHTDAWAVGDIQNSINARDRSGEAGHLATSSEQALILHWNGTKWTQVKTLGAGTPGVLNAVGASSPGNAWAVGATSAGPQGVQTLALHWDGQSWTRVATPRFSVSGGDNPFLNGVTVTSTSNAWAVGSFPTASGDHTLILQWNGSTWVEVPSPNPGTTSNNVLLATAGSANNAWAVGYFDASPRQAMAFHCC